MKLLVLIDQEGCSNVTPSLTTPDRVSLMLLELKNFLKTVPSEYNVTVLDCHNNGLSILPLKAQFPNIKFISQIWNFNINEKYDIAVLIGFHAAEGVASPFAHTFRKEISNVFLGNKKVGEVTLIVNWLSSMNIHVILIHGEKELKKEVDKLQIPFVASSPSFNDIIHTPKHIYKDNVPIKIKLVCDKFLDAFPTKLFTINKNFLYFKNIHVFFSSLSNISIFLNAARNYYYMYVKKLFNIIQWNYSEIQLKKINNKKIRNILKAKNIFSISIKDIEYLAKYFLLEF